MTSSSMMPASVFVSVQARRQEWDPVRGHLAEGFLVAPDLVLVPAMPRERLSDSDEYDILFVPADLAEMQWRERIAAATVMAHGLSERQGPFVVFIRLTRPTTFPIFRTANCTPDQLASALRQHHTEPESSVDVLPRGHVQDVAALLAQVPPTPTLEPLHGLHVQEHASVGILARSICNYVPWCILPRVPEDISVESPSGS